MADYKEMYLKLFRAQTKALLAMQTAQDILEEAQKEAEEMFLSAEDLNLRVLYPETQESEGTGLDRNGM